MKNIFLNLLSFCFSFLFLGCTVTKILKPDLIITNATILDNKTSKILENKTLLIHNGIITEISDNEVYNNKKSYKSIKTINANGKLVTAGFIDTHIHPTDVFGDYADDFQV